MTNEQSGVPMGRHAQKQPPVNQVASQLSQSLPVVNIEETAPQYTGSEFYHVTSLHSAQRGLQQARQAHARFLRRWGLCRANQLGLP